MDDFITSDEIKFLIEKQNIKQNIITGMGETWEYNTLKYKNEVLKDFRIKELKDVNDLFDKKKR